MLLMKSLIGSRGRGDHREDSDYDYFEVWLPTKEELFEAAVGLRSLSKIEHKQGEEDTVKMYLPHFILQLYKGNFNAMDALYAKHREVDCIVGRYLRTLDWKTEALKSSLMGFTKDYLHRVGTEKDEIQASLRVQQAFYLNTGYSTSHPRIGRTEIENLYRLTQQKPVIDNPIEIKYVIKRALGLCGLN